MVADLATNDSIYTGIQEYKEVAAFSKESERASESGKEETQIGSDLIEDFTPTATPAGFDG